jgi:hypothetical protein
MAATYDASNFVVWVTYDDTTVITQGVDLFILDTPSTPVGGFWQDLWRLTTVAGVNIVLLTSFGDGVASADLQGPVLENFTSHVGVSEIHRVSHSTHMGSVLTSITKVPEPASLTLFGLGVALITVQRRRH